MKNLLLATLLFLSFAHAETFQCKVVGVTDGDTIKCLTDQKEQVKVRLYQIDAPESGQAYGEEAKEILKNILDSSMLNSISITIEDDKTLYPTIIARATIAVILPCPKLAGHCPPPISSIDLGTRMIELGYAWYYPFTKKNPEYQQAEQEAKAAKRGLWADKHAMPPWEYRKQKKGKK